MESTSGRLEIYNMALGYVGTRTVGSPNEPTPEAIQCNLFWDRARRSTLRDFPYRFAVRRVRLPEKEMPDVYADEWRHCYGLPDGTLKIVRVHDGGRRGVHRTPFCLRSGDEGEIILCNLDAAMADYVVDVEDISKWDESFVQSMARKLACLICVPLRKGDAMLGTIVKLYQESIPSAEGADASEAYDSFADDAWLLARGAW